jgi:hypothetical protein
MLCRQRQQVWRDAAPISTSMSALEDACGNSPVDIRSLPKWKHTIHSTAIRSASLLRSANDLLSFGHGTHQGRGPRGPVSTWKVVVHPAQPGTPKTGQAIILKPIKPAFSPIILDGTTEGVLCVVAELVEVLGSPS